MPKSHHHNVHRIGIRSTLQLIVSLLLAATPASANGTFDFDPCTEPDVRRFHIDRTLQLDSVTRDGQAIDLADAPALIWNGEPTDAHSYTVSALAGGANPSFGLLRQRDSVAFFFAGTTDGIDPAP